MGLARAMGRTIMKRLESSPAVREQMEKSERARPVLGEVNRLVYSPLGDSEVCARLRERVPGDGVGVTEALEHSARMRDDFIRDRAYRLLAAAAAGDPVEPIQPAKRELFAAEENLGRMPLRQAFEFLEQLEPGLRKARAAVESLPPEPRPSPGADRPSGKVRVGPDQRIRRALNEHAAVGPTSANDHALVRTNLANSIATTYLDILVRNPSGGDTSVSYFDSPAKRQVSSGRLFGKKPPPPTQI